MEVTDLEQYKIMIFTRSMNFKLFELSSQTIGLPFKHVRLKHTSALGYFYKILKYDIDYAINIDEDAFVVDSQKLVELLKYVIANNIVNCGFPDGGVLQIRGLNPLVTNAFFNILNVKEIKKKLNYKEIENFDFRKYDYEKLAPTHLFKSYVYEYGISEPYDHFFLWLNLNYKVLYLGAESHKDGYTTLLKDMNNEVFLAHSWFSRFYGKDKTHTQRINNLFTEYSCEKIREFNKVGDQYNEWLDFLSFYYSKIKMEIRTRFKKWDLVDYI